MAIECPGSIIQYASMPLIWQDDLDKLTCSSKPAALTDDPFEVSGAVCRRKAAVHCMRGRALLACCVGLDAGVPPAKGPLTEVQCHVLMHG